MDESRKFENVRPKNLEILSRHPFKVPVFFGASQIKIPFDLAEIPVLRMSCRSRGSSRPRKVKTLANS